MTHWFKVLTLYLLPHHLLSRVVQWGARSRHFPFRKSITRWFIRHYNVDMSEALEPDPNAYPNFNSFFTRVLRPEARPVDQEAGQLCFPADAAISQLGDIQGGADLSIKGTHLLPDRTPWWFRRAGATVRGWPVCDHVLIPW